MPRSRQIAVNEATRTEIKAIARQLMIEKGTAGLSLRAIARKMDMTAPALYHYFASLDDLITAMIVDAFTGYADYVRHQRDLARDVGHSYVQQIFAASIAYREWAIQNPLDFQLIYGNPIPGYSAPADLTVPAASQMSKVFMEILVSAIEAGHIQLPPLYQRVPPTIAAHYRQRFGMDNSTAPIFHLMMHFWSVMHGLVTLEIYDHTTPVIGDTALFYEQEIENHFHLLGIDLNQVAAWR